MESPVRICLGAAVVVNLLLLCSTTVPVNASLPQNTSTSTEKALSSRYAKANGTTWAPRGRVRNADVALNELNPKESVSEEQTDAKNAKYKDRGRIKFHASTQTTNSPPLRKLRRTESPKVTIVTPTPEKKNMTQILDSMREYKKGINTISSTTPLTVENDKDSEEDDDYEFDDEYSQIDSDDKPSSFHEPHSFFTIPGFSDDDFAHSSQKGNKVPKGYEVPSYDKFSSYFPSDSYGAASESFKPDSYLDFDLTTPRNDYFDKKFKEISNSIKKNLAAIKAKTPASNTSDHQVAKENVGVEKLIKGIPTNKSTVYIKNTKEIRVLDNDEAGSSNKELSDVHGTSIYYEMSVLSTETYAIDHSNEDDCDNDTLTYEPTPSTSSEEEIASKSTHENLVTSPAKSSSSTQSPFPLDTSTHPSPISSTSTVTTTAPFEPATTTETSTQKSFSSSYRNRSYSKRINFTSNRDNTNGASLKPVQVTPNPTYRPVTRRIHYTTPKTKPIWMAPRRNYTRPSYTKTTSTYPTTIYAEHFNIKDTTSRINTQNKTSALTTVSDIDPILESDVGGAKKVVHSQAISDNSIPQLRKRGSMKFSTTTSSSEVETETAKDIMEIPPTLTAWALAGLISPPSIAPVNRTSTHTTQKSVDDNELENISEPLDSKEVTTSKTINSATTNSNSKYSPKKMYDVDQNKLLWKPTYNQPLNQSETESKSERVPAESIISVQSSAQPSTTEALDITTDIENPTAITEIDRTESTSTTTNAKLEDPAPTKSNFTFESITKLPSGITTPHVDENVQTESSAATTQKKDDFEVTTIRFTYIPTILDDVTESTQEPITTDSWHPVTIETNTVDDTPVTTYRPKQMTTTDYEELATTVEATTVKEEIPTTIELKTEPPTAVRVETEISHLETSTVIVEIVTEINTERETRRPTMKPLNEKTTVVNVIDSSSEENSGSNEVITQEKTTLEAITENNKDITVIPMSKPEVGNKIEPTESVEIDTDDDKQSVENNEEITEKSNQFNTEETTTMEIKTSMATKETVIESSTEQTTRLVNELEDMSGYGGDMTTEASSRVLDEEGSGAGVAIAVSTIGVIALIMLVGLLLVVRKRGRRTMYAQRCTPVSLDAYSLDSVSVGHRKGNHRLRASKRSYGNPAYDDEVTSHPMQYAALANFALDTESMTAEFSEIPSVVVRPDEVPAGCEDKNRFSNVLPLPETRVMLKRIGGDSNTEYINANYITGPGNIKNYYIACQAPLPNTVIDFWRMMWEQNSRLAVMLTEYMENGVEKCYEYLPPSEITDNKRTFGDFQIVLKKREQREKYAISSVQLINLETRTWREITHLWYFWPAKGVPDDYDSVIDFLSEMRTSMKISQTAKEFDEQDVEVIYGADSRSSFHNLTKLKSDEPTSHNGVHYSPQKAEQMFRRSTNNGTLSRMKAASEVEGVRPCVCICASGAGRTATVIALDICTRAMAAGIVDVPRVVRELRAQRPHSLANRHHYIFLYKVLSEYGNKLMGVDAI